MFLINALMTQKSNDFSISYAFVHPKGRTRNGSDPRAPGCCCQSCWLFYLKSFKTRAKASTLQAARKSCKNVMECSHWQICHLCSMAEAMLHDGWDCGLFKLFLWHAKPGFHFWDREGELHFSLVSPLALEASPLWDHARVGRGSKTAMALIKVLQSPQCLICVSWLHFQRWATLQIWDWTVISPSHIVRCFTFTWCVFQSDPWSHLGNILVVWGHWQCTGDFCRDFQPYLQLNVGGFCDDGKKMSSSSLPGEAHVNQDIPTAGRSRRVKWTWGGAACQVMENGIPLRFSHSLDPS